MGDEPNAETRAAIAEVEAGGLKSFGSVPELMADLNAPDKTTLAEAVRQIAEGTFYQDHDYAAGPGLRVLRAAETAMTLFCIRVEAGQVRSKRTYAEFCTILGRTPQQ